MDESILTPASYATDVGIHVMGRSTAQSSSFALPSSVNENMFHRKQTAYDDTSFLPFPATSPHPSRFPVNAPARLAATKYLYFSNRNGITGVQSRACDKQLSLMNTDGSSHCNDSMRLGDNDETCDEADETHSHSTHGSCLANEEDNPTTLIASSVSDRLLEGLM